MRISIWVIHTEMDGKDMKMKIEIMYYKLLSVIYNLCPKGKMKDRIGEYATERFPVVERL